MLGGLIGRIFGSEKAFGRVITKVSDGLDKLYYSSEEQAEDAAARAKARADNAQAVEKLRMEAADRVAAHTTTWLQETKGQNLSRRLLALGFGGSFLGCLWAMIGLKAIAPFSSRPEVWLESGEAMREGLIILIPLVGIIIGFYFAATKIASFADSGLEMIKENIAFKRDTRRNGKT